MKKLSLSLVLACVAIAAVSVGARSSVSPAGIGHTHVAGVSDPDPTDCPFCAGNPQVHVRALWAIEKAAASIYALRLL